MAKTKTHGIAKKNEATTDKKTEKNRKNQNLLSVTTGLPKHGTQWARAQHPMLRELGREERTAPTVRLSVRLHGKQPPATK